MSLNNTITIHNLAKVFALVGTIIAGWVYLTSNFVSSAEFRKHNYTIHASFTEMQIDIIEDRMDRALESGEDMKLKKLSRRRDRLERKQEIITEKQLE